MRIAVLCHLKSQSSFERITAQQLVIIFGKKLTLKNVFTFHNGLTLFWLNFIHDFRYFRKLMLATTRDFTTQCQPDLQALHSDLEPSYLKQLRGILIGV